MTNKTDREDPYKQQPIPKGYFPEPEIDKKSYSRNTSPGDHRKISSTQNTSGSRGRQTTANTTEEII